jgi:hypothetical protein
VCQLRDQCNNAYANCQNINGGICVILGANIFGAGDVALGKCTAAR